MSLNRQPLTVLLVDDQLLFRKGLESVLADWPDVQVVGEAENGLEAIAKAHTLRPDIVLMDINMPHLDGLKATELIRHELPDVKVLVLTVSEQDENLFEAIKVGAHGYLLKDLKPEVLHEMLLAVARGEVPISPLMAKKIINEFARQLPLVPVPKPVEELTPREKEVLALVAAGMDNQEIAERLFLAEGTVKRHLHNILAKLQARSRREAAAYAVRHGIIPPAPLS